MAATEAGTYRATDATGAPTPPGLTCLLDTNVVSELARPRPHPVVLQQFQHRHAQLALPTPVWHELQFGCLRLPAGQRRSFLESFLTQTVSLLPKLPYDAPAALVHARLRAQAEARGRVMPLLDGQIAAIAIAQGLTLVTRNLRDFEGLPHLRLADWFNG